MRNRKLEIIFKQVEEISRDKGLMLSPELVLLKILKTKPDSEETAIIYSFLCEILDVSVEDAVVFITEYIIDRVDDSKENLERYEEFKASATSLEGFINWILINPVCITELFRKEVKKALSNNGSLKGSFVIHNSSPERKRDSESSSYYEDLTASEIKMPCIGREDEMDDIIRVLLRKTKANPILTGEAGVGKTSVVRGLAEKIRLGNVPEPLKNTPLFMLDIPAMLSGTSLRGEFEENVLDTLKEIEEIGKEKGVRPILFIDEIHTIVGCGTGSNSSMDLANILKPKLADGTFSLIGATTTSEYEKIIKMDNALDRRFYPVLIEEPSLEDTLTMLNGLKDSFEDYHSVSYDKKSLDEIIRLCSRYIPDKRFPDKAIDIMDEAGAKARLLKKSDITVDFIRDIVSKRTKIPVSTVMGSEKDMLLSLEDNLKSQIFGQDMACETVARAVKVSRAFGSDKPSTMLFVGTTGTGKTALCKALCKSMNMNLIKIDCSELQESVAVAKLTGSAPGYVGYEEGGKLITEIMRNPYSVILFDEIEKAHPDIYNLLLQLLDEGKLTDGKGRVGNFKNAICVFTSNCGVREAEKNNFGFSISSEMKKGNSAILSEIKSHFSPEFLNRIDCTVLFNPVANVSRLIAKKELESFLSKISNTKICFDESVLEKLANCGISSETGARLVQRVVLNEIKPLIADEILFGKLSNGGSAKILVKDNKFILSNVRSKAKA